MFANTVCFLLVDEDDLRDVKSAVADLAGKWKDLGISLGIRLSELNAILSTSPHSPSDCLSEMLALWLKQCYNVRTKLIHCLPSHIYYTKYTTLATKGSWLKTLKNLSTYKLSLWLVDLMLYTVLSPFPRWRNLGSQLGDVWLGLSRTRWGATILLWHIQ